jgi:F420-dependent oxidoreductase-like protein
VKFSIWPSPTNPWEETLATAQHAERTGWDGVWFADHFMPNAADTSGPTSEAWTTIAALAAVVPRVRIGTLVTGNTYRHPAVLAKMAANVDLISGGRLVLGLGSGWQENEHEAYGIEFSTVPGRLKRLDEACQVIVSMFENEQTNFEGKYYRLKDAPNAPKPARRPPLLIGGGGEKVTMRIAAKYADEWNVWGTPDLLRAKMAVLDEHCRAMGRDPKSIKRSAQALLLISDDREAVERFRGVGRPVIAGNVDEVKAVVGGYAEAGVDELIIPGFNLGTGDRIRSTMDTFINEVAPEFR